jgi:uncharacterized protein
VKLVDANILLSAVNEADQRHATTRAWLDEALSGREPVGFSWVVVLAFLRLSTKLGLFPSPLAAADATAIVEAWLGATPSVVVEPTSRHVALLSGLLAELGTGGNLVSDAHLAALALEHDAVVVTYDNDFGRFRGVSWERPGP